MTAQAGDNASRVVVSVQHNWRGGQAYQLLD